jgi:hypothetical protein
MNQVAIEECRASEARVWLDDCSKTVERAESRGFSCDVGTYIYIKNIGQTLFVVRGAEYANLMVKVMREQYSLNPNRWPKISGDVMGLGNLGVAA